MDNKIKAYGICLYKKDKNTIEILLCKSTLSKKKWGFLKGVKDNLETKQQTAVREFYEESGIDIKPYQLERYFEQKNKNKDIGIFLVNFAKIKDIYTFFTNNRLKDNYLCIENSDVRFFNIENLPPIKKKQVSMMEEIVNYLK